MVASISAVSSAAAAKSYYGKDNYYAKTTDRPEPSAWFGKGADRLGLTGEVDLETFEKVLEGQTLDGKRIGQKPGETLEQAMARPHRPGVDLTFSPPKDVSLLLYLGGDKRLLAAHRAAVGETLKWVEKNMAGTRIRPPVKEGEKQKPAIPVKTGNLVIAKFEHDISRDKDPQLHTHSVIANMTWGEGKWRALHNDPLFAHRKTISLAYDAAMREKVRDLGYEVRLTDGKSGAWGIVGVPEEAKEEFSKGHERINKAAENLDNPTPAAKAKLAVKTRPSKTEMSQEDRYASWERRGEPWKIGLQDLARSSEARAERGDIESMLDKNTPSTRGFEGLKAKLIQTYFRPTRTLRREANDPYGSISPLSERDYAARAAVSFAFRHLEEREAAFSLHHVRRAALEHGADGLTMVDVDRHLRDLRAAKKVMVNARDPSAESTTKAALNHERRTRGLVRSAGQTAPLIMRAAIHDRLRETRLTQDQRRAIETILSGTNRLVGVQGYAGTGKTTMMSQTASLAGDLAGEADKGGYKLLGLAPTHSARATLEESAGFASQTVQSLFKDLKAGRVPKDIGRTIVLIDESSFLSTKNMNQILERLISLKPARVVLSGDRRQHGAVEAGRPFDLAQRAGMRTAIMKDVVRLPKDDAHKDQRAGVMAAAEGRMATAMIRLDATMVERPDENGLAKGAVDAWKGLPRATQDQALIVAPGHRVRTDINNAIRAEMIEDGRLGSDATRLPILQAKDMTRAEAVAPRTYKPKDVMVFHARLAAVNVRRGGVRTVIAVDEERGRITIENARGKRQTLPLERLMGRSDTAPFSLARKGELEIREDDKLLVTRSDKERGLAALDHAKVKGFDEQTVTLDIKGTEQVFERSDPALQSLTHGYAITSHAAQGKTASDVVAVIDSREHMLTSQVGFYVSVSRSADTLGTIVDDKAKVLSALERHTGLKSSALDAVHRMGAISGLDQSPSADPGLSENGARDASSKDLEPATASHDPSASEQGRDQDVGADMEMEPEPPDMDISL